MDTLIDSENGYPDSAIPAYAYHFLTILGTIEP
jgi:hypothetical protein